MSSLGPGKIPWTEQHVKLLAAELKGGLPPSIMGVLQDPEWKGGGLTQIKSEMGRPTSDDILVNFHWILPFARAYPRTVPSSLLCADVFLCLDRMMLGTLLRAPPGASGELADQKKVLAGTEGANIKRLMGGLRYLWRSSIVALVSVGEVYCHGCAWILSALVSVKMCGCAFAGKGAGNHPRITQLKSYLQASPERSSKSSKQVLVPWCHCRPF